MAALSSNINFFSRSILATDSSIAHLQTALKHISSWMSANLLTLNSSKTEFLIIGLKQQLSKINNNDLDLSKIDNSSLHTTLCTQPWFLPARRYASAGYSDRNVSVRLSVCPSVTRRYCVKTKKASVMISSPSGSPKTLVF